MKCMFCGCLESKVIDSRSTDEGRTIRRRRECMECGRRFTTYETIETTPVLVVKNSGNRQAFDPNKVYRQFTDISSFMSELESMMKEEKNKRS